MKKSVCFTIFAMFLLFAFAALPMSAEAAGMKTMTGKVIGVDQGGKGISISSMAGGKEIVAGAIVDDSTQVTVKGKKAGLMDIKEGDTVTLVYTLEKDDLYAKKVMKK
ncbi:MAG: hypothetical protein KA801_11390 [Syntrophorhabdaceae bacterium]|nr:hypothetical protein [Syntrophorhabdaceae bacterium]